MAGYDKRVYEGVCVKESNVGGRGHSIHSLVVENAIDPSTKSIVSRIETFCTQCGMSLEEMRNPPKTRRSKKQQEASSVSA